MGSPDMGAWILLWIFMGLALAVTADVVIARIVGTGRGIGQPQGRTAEPTVFRASCPADALPAPAELRFLHE